jgi:hypothetical protein
LRTPGSGTGGQARAGQTARHALLRRNVRTSGTPHPHGRSSSRAPPSAPAPASDGWIEQGTLLLLAATVANFCLLSLHVAPSWHSEAGPGGPWKCRPYVHCVETSCVRIRSVYVPWLIAGCEVEVGDGRKRRRRARGIVWKAGARVSRSGTVACDAPLWRFKGYCALEYTVTMGAVSCTDCIFQELLPYHQDAPTTYSSSG